MVAVITSQQEGPGCDSDPGFSVWSLHFLPSQTPPTGQRRASVVNRSR